MIIRRRVVDIFLASLLTLYLLRFKTDYVHCLLSAMSREVRVQPFASITGVTAARRLAGVLASGGEDRRICVWDLSRSDGAGEGANKPLIFMHSGHRGGVRAPRGPCMPPMDWLTDGLWSMSFTALK